MASNRKWTTHEGILSYNLTPRAGDELIAERTAMTMMDPTIGVEAATGDIISGLERQLVGGENEGLFLSRYRAVNGSGEVVLRSPLPAGRISHYRFGGPILMEAGGFLAMTPNVKLGGRLGNLASVLGGEGAFWMRAQTEEDQSGIIFMTSLGAIIKRDLAEGQRMVIDSSHLLAIEERVGLEVGLADRSEGNFLQRIANSLLTGENQVLLASGPGSIYMEQFTPLDMQNWLNKLQARAARNSLRRRPSRS